MDFSRFFIDRPIFAARVPRSGAAVGGGAHGVSGRQPQGHRRNRRLAAGRIHQRRGRHAVHAVAGQQRRQPDADGQLQAGRGPGQGAAAGAEPRVASAAAPAAGRAAPGRDHRQELAHADAGRALDLAQ
ncbi:hypothetical protein G6F31_019139 [Rhizopus arrhizus]|nr:hypothetical protein G6F31_019139 [Rhizopus arrhizus]